MDGRVGNFFEAGEGAAEAKRGVDVFGRETRVVFENHVNAVAAGEGSEDLRDEDASAANHGVAVADEGIDLDMVVHDEGNYSIIAAPSAIGTI